MAVWVGRENERNLDVRPLRKATVQSLHRPTATPMIIFERSKHIRYGTIPKTERLERIKFSQKEGGKRHDAISTGIKGNSIDRMHTPVKERSTNDARPSQPLTFLAFQMIDDIHFVLEPRHSVPRCLRDTIAPKLSRNKPFHASFDARIDKRLVLLLRTGTYHRYHGVLPFQNRDQVIFRVFIRDMINSNIAWKGGLGSLP